MNAGDELEPLARVVAREDVRAYAEASGDRNPLHLDDAAARAAGFDTVIAHGMFTMGHMATCVVAAVGEGAVVERISAQFRAPVSLGDEVVAGGTVRSVDGSLATIDAWVRVERDGDVAWPVRKGEIVVRLPSA